MDKLKILEGNELDLLNGKNGIEIETVFFGKKKKWRATYFPLGLMDVQSELYHKLELDYEQKHLPSFIGTSVKKNAKLCAEIIAVTMLGKRWKIFLFRKILKQHFLWQVDSQALLDFTNKLIQVSNYKGFITSIGSISVMRTTSPENETPAKAVQIEDLEAPTE